MARLAPLAFDDLEGDHAALFDTLRESYGQLPSSFLTLGRMPALLDAVSKMALAALGEGQVEVSLKWMVAHVASRAAGCSYCSAHTGFHAAESAGVPVEKVEALWEFETSELFSPREVAALRVARDAAITPNQVTDQQFVDLKRYFTDDEIVEIVAPVAMFGFFNRWNDTFSTDLEREPSFFASEHLGATGWKPKRPSEPDSGEGEAAP
jgi:uncharacterized peroxidase-related enzyme